MPGIENHRAIKGVAIDIQGRPVLGHRVGHMHFMQRQMSDPLPGLTLGLASQQQLFGLVAFLAQTSSTVGACLEKIMQLEPLISNIGKTCLEYSPGEAQLIWHCHIQDPFVRTHVGSFILFTYTQLINTGTQAGHPVPVSNRARGLTSVVTPQTT